MSDTPYISLNDAAKLTGRAKSTISKALKTGKMSYISKDPKAGFQLDPAEVLRVFPEKTETVVSFQSKNTQKHSENSALLAEVDALRQQAATIEIERAREREQLNDRIESLHKMLADETSERRQLTVLLTDQRESPRKGLWGFFHKS